MRSTLYSCRMTPSCMTQFICIFPRKNVRTLSKNLTLGIFWEAWSRGISITYRKKRSLSHFRKMSSTFCSNRRKIKYSKLLKWQSQFIIWHEKNFSTIMLQLNLLRLPRTLQLPWGRQLRITLEAISSCMEIHCERL